MLIFIFIYELSILNSIVKLNVIWYKSLLAGIINGFLLPINYTISILEDTSMLSFFHNYYDGSYFFIGEFFTYAILLLIFFIKK